MSSMEVQTERPIEPSHKLDSSQSCPGKSKRPIVIGHRGFRMNKSPEENVRENTVYSLKEGHRAGAEVVEFDVQITSDGIPVLWHDDRVVTLVDNSEICSREVSELTLCEFRTVTTGRSVDLGGRKHQLVRKFKSQQPTEGELPWTCKGAVAPELPEDISCNSATLQEALEGTPVELGFNIELKYDSSRPSSPQEREAHLTKVLLVVGTFASERQILFSSFDVDACLEVRRMQDKYPVYQLTCMDPVHPDPRRRSLKAAVDVVLGEGNLNGVVAHSNNLFSEFEQIKRLKEANLPLFTYGEGNSDPSLVAMQILAGATGVITDSIDICHETLRKLTELNINNVSLGKDLTEGLSASVTPKQAVAA